MADIFEDNKYYVDVTTTFDSSGFMSPVSIEWNNGTTLHIDQIISFRPAYDDILCDSICFTVMIRGKEYHLFFERTSQTFRAHVGRWYVLLNR